MSLKTDYKDDILNTSANISRKYDMISNTDGTVSFADRTVYTQNGDSFGGGDINNTNLAVNSMVEGIDITLSTDGWVESESRYTYTYQADKVYTIHPLFGMVDGSEDDYGLVTSMMADDEANTLTFYAESQPNADFTVNVKGVYGKPSEIKGRIAKIDRNQFENLKGTNYFTLVSSWGDGAVITCAKAGKYKVVTNFAVSRQIFVTQATSTDSTIKNWDRIDAPANADKEICTMDLEAGQKITCGIYGNSEVGDIFYFEKI